ncbi:unnamed protein product [Prunus armeniaca]
MGNWVGRDKGLHQIEDQGSKNKTSTNSVRIKVRLTSKQLEELMAELHITKARFRGRPRDPLRLLGRNEEYLFFKKGGKSILSIVDCAPSM